MTELSVMSFNVWRGGGLGLELTIDVIRRANPDIAGLQECKPDVAEAIAEELGAHWIADEDGHAILSRHPIVDSIGPTANEWGGLGAIVEIGPRRRRARLFDAHLHWIDYGPYTLHDDPSRAEAAVLEHERAIRMPGLGELLDLMSPAQASKEPTFLVGDFNAPSDLDYPVSLGWPESIACRERGLEDSYRAVHPAQRIYTRESPFAFEEPGITWSPMRAEEVRGVFDRIDFVYHAPSGGTVVKTSVVLDAKNSVSPWPSDHRAVLSTFTLR